MKKSALFLLKAIITASLFGGIISVSHARVFIENGSPVRIKAESGSWGKQGEYLKAYGKTGTLSIGDQISTGDFHFVAKFKADSYASNPGGVLINQSSDIGFVFNETRDQTFVRGYFFSDRTQTQKHRSHYFNDNDDVRLDIIRTGDNVNFLLNNKQFYSIPYESDRVFGKISFRENGGGFGVKHAELLSGSTTDLSTWLNPREVKHELKGFQTNVFSRGSGGYHTYRIPAIIKAPDGTLLAFCEGRKNSPSDAGKIDMLLKRSTDGGKTWGPQQVIHGEEGDVTIGNPVPVYDKETGRIWLVFCRNNERVFTTFSENNGETWARVREITSMVKGPDWPKWYATGPGHGIQLKSGRLFIPANHGKTAHALWSDDNGLTWKAGKPVGNGTNEVMALERSDGIIYLNARNSTDIFNRKYALSSDGGETWSAVRDDKTLVESVCQGSLLSLDGPNDKKTFLFCNPASVRRERLTIRMSKDEGFTWNSGYRVYDGSSAYSDMVDLGEGKIGVIYERDWYQHLTFAIVDLADINTSGIEHWKELEADKK